MSRVTTGLLTARSDKANFIWMLAGTVGFTGSQWLLLALFARLGSAGVVGDYSLALAIVTPVFLLFSLNLRSALVTETEPLGSFDDYARLRTVMLLFASLFSLLATRAIYPSTFVLGVVLLACAIKVADLASDLIYGLLQAGAAMDRIGKSRLLQAGLQASAGGITFALSGSLLLSLAAIASASFGTFVVYDLKSRRLAITSMEAPPSSPRRPSAAVLAMRTAPLGLATAVDALSIATPRFYLESAVGREAVGQFAVVAYLVTAQSLLVVAAADVYRPQLARAYSESLEITRQPVNRMIQVSSAAALLGLAGSWLVGSRLLHTLYGPEFASLGGPLVILMIGAMPLNLAGVATTILLAMRRFRFVLLAFGAQLIATAVACKELVPTHGLDGAAWSLAAGATARLVVASFLAILSFWRSPSAAALHPST